MLTQDWLSIIQAAANAATVLVSIGAIIIAIHAEKRNQLRFDAQLKENAKIASAHVKPLLATFTDEFDHFKAITLTNNGMGTAIIDNVAINKGNRIANCVANLFTFDIAMTWDNYWSFTTVPMSVKPGQEYVLCSLSLEQLEHNVHNAMEANNILESWQRQLEGITIRLSYTDVFGVRQPDYERVFHS